MFQHICNVLSYITCGFIQTHVIVCVCRVFTGRSWLPVELCMLTLSKHPWMSVCLPSVCPSVLHVLLPACRGSHGHHPPPSLLVHPHDVALCHWVFGRSQDHSGALMAEEFKACLISLGYDVENDKQVGAPGQEGGTELVRPLSRRATVSSTASRWANITIIYITD